jgi:hypothetical protein
MRDGMHLLYSNGPDAPPVVVSFRQDHSGVPSPTIAGLSSRASNSR